jgi:hypothetical protein
MKRLLARTALLFACWTVGACELVETTDSAFVAQGDNELSALSYNMWLYPARVFLVPFNEGQDARGPVAAKLQSGATFLHESKGRPVRPSTDTNQSTFFPELSATA